MFSEGENLTVTMEGLRPYWDYQVQVASVNIAGLGNNSTLTEIIRTDQDSKCNLELLAFLR